METQEINKLWAQHHIDPWWTNYKNLNYSNEEFNDTNSLSKWRLAGFTQTKFTGDMYDMRNPEPVWVTPFRRYFQWRHFSWSVYKMGPGCVLPNHRDTYTKFKSLHNIINEKTICRAIVFLEDWKSGHYFEIDSVPILNWKAGDVVVWRYDTPHTAANIGFDDRYTLQITGVVDEDSQFQ